MNNLKLFVLISITIVNFNLFAQGPSHIYNHSAKTIKIIQVDKCGISIIPFVKNNNVKIEIQYGISWDTSRLSSGQKGTGFVELDLKYSIKNSNSEIVFENSQREYLNPITNHKLLTQIYVAQENMTLPLDDYVIECKVKNLQSNSSLKESYSFKSINYPLHELYLSEIEISSAIGRKGKEWVNPSFVKGEYVVVPYPFKKIDRKNPIYFYVEIDNLQYNAKLYSEYKVEYKLVSNASKIVGSEYVQSTNAGSVQEFFSINFENVKNGKYRFEIEVTDQVANVSRSSVIQLQLTD